MINLIANGNFEPYTVYFHIPTPTKINIGDLVQREHPLN